jgi:hypothetical protein
MSAVSEPTVTVVIGSNAPPERLAACLQALEPQREGVEVLVQEGQPSPAELRERFPWADFAAAAERLVPEHWRDGIDRASGEIVALTIAQMIPAADWIATMRKLHADHDVVGGAIEPGHGLRLVDWGEYFCRYSREMRPFPARESLDLAGDNAAYSRSQLEDVREVYQDGFWEPEVHRRLALQGVELWQTPALLVRQGRSAGFRTFVQQRLKHGRSHGRQRGSQGGLLQNVGRVIAAPLVPFVMTARVARLVFAKGRFRARLLTAVPLVFAFNVAWAVGEAVGHADRVASR